MLDVLQWAEDNLGALLDEGDAWKSKCINYTPPVVDRLYRDFRIPGGAEESHRLYLHRIHPCERAFFHPHPWPSAVRVIGGEGSRYFMGIGFGPNERHDPPPCAAVTVLTPGSRYAMPHPDGWHYVRIEGAPSVSLMVSGPEWGRPGGAPRTAKHEFRPLTDEESASLVRDVRGFYRL